MKRHKNQKYLQFVRALPCIHCGSYESDAHHIIGIGRGAIGTKESDIHTMPLCRVCHTEVHKNPKLWPQAAWMKDTQNQAVAAGVL